MAKKKKTKDLMEGYESLNVSTQTQLPQQTVYINPNYERGDNVASISAITETINASTTATGSLLYMCNDVEPVDAYRRTYSSSTDGTRGATLIFDAGAIFAFRQVFLDYFITTTGTPTASMAISASQDGVTYTTLDSASHPINTSQVDNLIAWYVQARYIKIVVTLTIGASQSADCKLNKLRLII